MRYREYFFDSETSLYYLNASSKLTLRFLTGLIEGSTEAAYDLTSYLLGKLLSVV